LDRMQRTLAVDISYTISRMEVLERLPGNPIGINYRWVDETAVALMSRLPSFSRVVGLRAGHEQRIEELVCWYREHGIKPTFEMVPGHYAALRELHAAGYSVASVLCQNRDQADCYCSEVRKHYGQENAERGRDEHPKKPVQASHLSHH
jgi:hypothetical protein